MSKKPKTIVIVSDTIYPYFKGGKEKRIFEITTRLAHMGYDVHLYTMKWWDGPSTIVENGVHLHGIGKLHQVYVNEDGKRSIKAGIYFALVCLRLLWVRFDVIDVDHMPYLPLFTVWFVCKLRHKKLYAAWHEVWSRMYWQEYLGTFGIIGYLVEFVSASLPDYIIVDSLHTKNKLIQRHPRKAKKLFVAYNGVDLTEVAAVAPSKNSYDVMYAGRLLKHKRVDQLLLAVKRLKATNPDIRCLILGNGPQKQQLVELTKSLSISRNVDLVDFLPEHKDVYALMKSAKAFVLPSEREGFGIVVIEANACGTPVVTYNYPHNAARELIEDGVNGYLFKDSEDLADKITLCLDQSNNNPRRYAQLLQKYDWRTTVNSTLKAYSR